MFVFSLTYDIVETEFDIAERRLVRRKKRQQRYDTKKHFIEHEKGGTCANENEKYAESILLELRDRDGVFDFVEYKKALDDVGIDWVVGRYILDSKYKRSLRVFIQHKSSLSIAEPFSTLNPCVVMWQVRTNTPALEAKIHLLEGVIEFLKHVKSPYAVFFEDKVEHFKNLKDL